MRAPACAWGRTPRVRSRARAASALLAIESLGRGREASGTNGGRTVESTPGLRLGTFPSNQRTSLRRDSIGVGVGVGIGIEGIGSGGLGRGRCGAESIPIAIPIATPTPGLRLGTFPSNQLTSLRRDSIGVGIGIGICIEGTGSGGVGRVRGGAESIPIATPTLGRRSSSLSPCDGSGVRARPFSRRR